MPSINFLDCTQLDMIEAAEIFAGRLTEVLARHEQVLEKYFLLLWLAGGI